MGSDSGQRLGLTSFQVQSWFGIVRLFCYLFIIKLELSGFLDCFRINHIGLESYIGQPYPPCPNDSNEPRLCCNEYVSVKFQITN